MSQHQATMLPVMRPQLPTAEELLPYLRRIDEARIYSNFGPLYHEFSERLAEYFGVEKDQIALIANGTLALQAAVETVGDIGDTWVMPSYTFVASGQAVLAARRRIHFVDVELETWAMAPTNRPFCHGQLVVAPHGARPPLEEWGAIRGPKVIDAASCFDACREIGPNLSDDMMVMVSLHATKPLPAGEGAVLIGPSDWVKRSSRWANFGFSGTRYSEGPGLNAKVSEYHSAVGLCSLDSWDTNLHEWRGSLALAQEVSQAYRLVPQPSMFSGLISSTWNLRLPEGVELEAAMGLFSSHGVATRSWWPAGVHQMPAFANQTADLLPNTDALVSSVIGLPFGRDLQTRDFDEVSASLEEVIARATETASPLPA